MEFEDVESGVGAPLRRRNEIGCYPVLPGSFGGTFATGMTELQSNFGRRTGMNEGHYSGQLYFLCLIPETKAAWRDPGICRHAGHFGKHQARAAERAAAEMDHMEVAGNALEG